MGFRDFRNAYKIAKEAGDIKAANELLIAAKNAHKSPSYLSELVRKEKEIVKSVSQRPNIGTKLEYFLGKATGSSHNIDRSTGMLRQLESIGLPDNAKTRKYLNNLLEETYLDPKNIKIIQENGRIVRESLIIGPNGVIKFETIWDGNKLITGSMFGPSGRFRHIEPK